MTWTEGHYWITEDLRIKSASHFQYKYAVKRDEEWDATWEMGIDRIADLAILPAMNDSSVQVKSVQIHDEWGHFTVKFGILYPSQSHAQIKRFLRVNGSRDELGSWLEGEGPKIMNQSNAKAYKNKKNG